MAIEGTGSRAEAGIVATEVAFGRDSPLIPATEVDAALMMTGVGAEMTVGR